MSSTNQQPQLASPGAGLPWVQTLVGQHVLLPALCLTHSWDRAQRMFEREGRRVLDLAARLNLDERDTRVLVRNIIGIEDSSRYWSVVLTLEHLIIVGDTMADILVDLSHNREPSARVDIAGVKPPGELPAADAIPAFREFLARHRLRTSRDVSDRKSPRRLDHPWFGRLTAHQWHCLAAMHQRIHRRQVEAIVERLA